MLLLQVHCRPVFVHVHAAAAPTLVNPTRDFLLLEKDILSPPSSSSRKVGLATSLQSGDTEEKETAADTAAAEMPVEGLPWAGLSRPEPRKQSLGPGTFDEDDPPTSQLPPDSSGLPSLCFVEALSLLRSMPFSSALVPPKVLLVLLLVAEAPAVSSRLFCPPDANLRATDARYALLLAAMSQSTLPDERSAME